MNSEFSRRGHPLLRSAAVRCARRGREDVRVHASSAACGAVHDDARRGRLRNGRGGGGRRPALDNVEVIRRLRKVARGQARYHEEVLEQAAADGVLLAKPVTRVGPDTAAGVGGAGRSWHVVRASKRGACLWPASLRTHLYAPVKQPQVPPIKPSSSQKPPVRDAMSPARMHQHVCASRQRASPPGGADMSHSGARQPPS